MLSFFSNLYTKIKLHFDSRYIKEIDSKKSNALELNEITQEIFSNQIILLLLEVKLPCVLSIEIINFLLPLYPANSIIAIQTIKSVNTEDENEISYKDTCFYIILK